MAGEERDTELAYVTRFRRGFRGHYIDDGQRRRGPVFSTEEEARFWALRKREELVRRANGEGRPQPVAFYRTIPLHDGGEPGEARARPRIHRITRPPVAPGAAFAAEQGTPQDAPASSGAPPAEPEAIRCPTETLERLDSVVHDFVASLDEDKLGAAGGGSSDHVERFQRLLDGSPATKSHVLGPPVVFGSSPAIGLDSMLALLGSLQKTGVLRVQAGETLFTVSIVRGDVVHGVSYPRPEAELLGPILISQGTIEPARLYRFLDECGSSASMIGEALNRQTLVSTYELQDALEHQLQLLFDRLLATGESEWCFHEGEATLAYIHMRMNVISVLLESARKNDEGLEA